MYIQYLLSVIYDMVFLQNKYAKWYFNIVNAAKVRDKSNGYFESHHIIPKCIGGDDLTSNKVRLTGREHFTCHFLLIKMLPKSKERNKLVYAAACMALTATGQKSKRYRPSAKLYEAVRRELRTSMSGSNHPRYGVRKPMSDAAKAKLSASRIAILADGTVAAKISEALKGRTPWNKGKQVVSEERKALISQQHKGKTISEEQKLKMSAALSGKKRTPISEETRELMRQAALSRKRNPMPKRGPMSEEQKLKLKEIALARLR